MAQSPAHILLVEDSNALARVYQEFLAVEGHTVTRVASAAAAMRALADSAPDIMVLDLQLPDANGIEVLKHVRAEGMSVAVVVVTANGSINVAVEAMREGAYDFIVKPISAERLIFTIRNSVERQTLSTIVQTYKGQIDRNQFCGFIGNSLPMQAVYRTIESAARSKASIFVTGESGTGKEVCAEAVHQTSSRNGKPFVALNCAAIPKDLMESEIFGHVKGAFTGATTDRTGAAMQANGGTLFLDEVCDMPLELQVKLLRFVQTGTVAPVGAQSTKTVDVRFICATNRDPMEEVRSGRFREDLFYRLHVIPIDLPPLRERDADVIVLARHFLEVFAKEEGRSFADFDEAACDTIQRYQWPGNVRQLQNVIRNIVVLNDAQIVTASMLSEVLHDHGEEPHLEAESALFPLQNDFGRKVSRSKPVAEEVRPLAEVERDAITTALDAADNNVARAAAMLEISPSTIYRKMARWGDGATMMASTSPLS